MYAYVCLYFSHDIVGNIVGVKFDINIDIVNIEIVTDFVVVVAEVIVLLNIVDWYDRWYAFGVVLGCCWCSSSCSYNLLC